MPIKPIKAVSAVIIRDGSVLLVKRTKAPLKNSWNLPGGKVKSGESNHAALAREIMEETSLELLDASYLGEVNIENYQLNVYKATVEAGIPNAGSDASEAKFVPLNALQPYELPAATISMIQKATPHSIKGHLKTALIAVIYGLGAYAILYTLMKILKFSGFQSF